MNLKEYFLFLLILFFLFLFIQIINIFAQKKENINKNEMKKTKESNSIIYAILSYDEKATINSTTIRPNLYLIKIDPENNQIIESQKIVDISKNSELMLGCFFPNFSNDGKKVVFHSGSIQNKGNLQIPIEEIFIMNLETNEIKKLISIDNSLSFYPIFSFDNKNIIFFNKKIQNLSTIETDLCISDINGKNIKEIGKTHDTWFLTSTFKNLIIYEKVIDYQKRIINIVAYDTIENKEISISENSITPYINKNGKLVFVKNNNSIHIADLKKLEQNSNSTIETKELLNYLAPMYPTISNDNSKVAFLAPHNIRLPFSNKLLLLDLNTKAIKEINKDGVVNVPGLFSNDSNFIFYIKHKGKYQILCMNNFEKEFELTKKGCVFWFSIYQKL